MGTRTGQTKQVHDNARGRINDIGGFPCNTVRCDYIFCHIMDLCYTYCISYKCWNLSIALQFPDHPFEDKESREGIINSHPFHFGCTQPDVNPPTLISRLLVPLPVNRHLRFIGSYAQSSSDRLYLSHLPSDSGVIFVSHNYTTNRRASCTHITTSQPIFTRILMPVQNHASGSTLQPPEKIDKNTQWAPCGSARRKRILIELVPGAIISAPISYVLAR